MKKQSESAENGLQGLGKALKRMGRFDLAEKYLLRLLDDSQSDETLAINLYEELSEIAGSQAHYDDSIRYRQRALELRGICKSNSPHNASMPRATISKWFERPEVPQYRSWSSYEQMTRVEFLFFRARNNEQSQ
jgi:tetratricopeptide (TPR) repeat protein